MKGFGEIGLDAVLFHPAKGRIGDNHVHAIIGPIIAQRTRQGIVMAHPGGPLDIMQEHVGDAQDVGQRFLFHALQAGLQLFLIGGALDILRADMVDGVGQKAAGARRQGRLRFRPVWGPPYRP